MRLLPTYAVLSVLLSLPMATHVVAGELPPSFCIDVETVLAKAGCNAGTCHGNQHGKGGFRLSLRGQDPDFDYRSLVEQYGGRRIDRLDPNQSLVLRKPTLQMPHQGGRRIPPESKLYHILHDWIAAGAPGPDNTEPRLVDLRVTPIEHVGFDPEDELQLDVKAVFSDGSRRDVTDVAVYEASNLNVEVSGSGLVRRRAMGEATVVVRFLSLQVPVRTSFLASSNGHRWQGPQPSTYVDRYIFAKLNKHRANPAARCEDHVFLRRAYLDTLGLLPSAEEAIAFARDTSPHKRIVLVDKLLARPEFADHWAMKWCDLLRNEENVLDRRGVEVFHRWIRDSMAAGKPLDQFVRELIVARGSTYKNPPTNYFRALREPKVRGEAAARVFLGTRLQCAQCHNHPFDRWTQNDYYAWAALFARVDYKIIENKRLDGLDKKQFVGEQLVQIKDDGEVENPATGQAMPPRFLGEESAVAKDAERLEELAAWLASPSNRQFARAQVNRLWHHVMGRGLVEPVDDFRLTNPASHPRLLEALTDDFVESGFDVRKLLRVVMTSETYQRTTERDGDTSNYRGIVARRLTAEQLLDAQSQVLDVPIRFNGHPTGIRAGQLPGVHKVRFRDEAPSAGDRFLFAFGKPERLMTCECERSGETTLSQALLLVSGPCVDMVLTAPSNRIGQLLERDLAGKEIVEHLYWAALSRAPSEAERDAARSTITRGDLRQGLEDVAWALINAKEFVFRH